MQHQATHTGGASDSPPPGSLTRPGIISPGTVHYVDFPVMTYGSVQTFSQLLSHDTQASRHLSQQVSETSAPGFRNLFSSKGMQVSSRCDLIPAHCLADVPRPVMRQFRISRPVGGHELVIEAWWQRRPDGVRGRRGHGPCAGALGAEVAFLPAAKARPEVIHRPIFPRAR